MEAFGDNLVRLLGVHRLSAKEAARLMAISESSFSKWGRGVVTPGWTSAVIVGRFFDINPSRLAETPFEDLLANELASVERFRDVEREVQQRRIKLREIDALPPAEQKLGRV